MKRDIKISENLKNIVVVLDGAADFKLKEIENKTPLEEAHVPHLDKITERGISGLIQTIPNGKQIGTETGFLNLFNYKVESNRAFEALGMNINIDKEDLVIYKMQLCITEKL